MTGVRYTITFEDLGVEQAFLRMATGAEDMTPLMDDIGSVLINGARERISDTNVGPDGVAWPKSFRVESGQGGKTLHDSGTLLASIVSLAGPREVAVGSNLIYAGVHQTGATIRPKVAGALFFTLPDGTEVVAGEVTIPARPYLGISESEAEDIREVVGLYFGQLLSGGADAAD